MIDGVDDAQELRAFLDRRLRRCGVSQRELAKRIGWDASLISHVKNGSKVPDPDSPFVRDLAAELGCSEELRRLVAQVRQRRSAPRLARLAQLAPAEPQLPGRRKLFEQLSEVAVPGGVCVLDGPAGIGKTALVLHWAGLREDTWPDGAVLVELHAHTPGTAPVSAGEALGAVLSDLGVTEVPEATEARSRLLRSLLHTKRLLLVLDDVDSAEQVRPLLPGAPGCTVVATTRHAAAARALVIRGTARHLRVPELDSAAAAELLSEQLGGDGGHGLTTADKNRVVSACGGMPLAVRAAAELVRSWPQAADTLIDDLDSPRRLHVLEVAAGGYAEASVRAAVLASVRHLPPSARALLLRLGRGRSGPLAAAAEHPGAVQALADEGLLLGPYGGDGIPSLPGLVADVAAELADQDGPACRERGVLAGA